MKLTKLFHCCFLLETGKTKVLIDPALSVFGEEANYDNYDFDHIIVSHAHFDHFEDAVELARQRNVKLTTVMSLKNYINETFSDVNTGGFQPGGTFMLGDIKVKVFLAMHESFLRNGQQMGLACYFAFDDGETTIAYLADSAFNPTYYHVEKLMGKEIDYVIVNIGTISSLNEEDAFIISNEIFKSATTIPAHYEMWKDDINIEKMKELYDNNDLKIIVANNYSKIF